MPEGHVIHRLARELATTLRGAPVAATSPQGRFSEGAELIDGTHLERADAYGKFLFATFARGPILHIHLGLIGKLRDAGADPAPTRPTIRLRLANDGHCWDLTGPQTCRIVDPVEMSQITSRIGADPLRRRPDVNAARARFALSAVPVGALLLDQRVISGLGNIYRAEILFLCGIDPLRPARSVTDDEFDCIWSTARRLMRTGVRTGRIICTDPSEVGVPIRRMTRDDSLNVYHRERCRRCGTEIGTVVLAGRPLQYCPTCQQA